MVYSSVNRRLNHTTILDSTVPKRETPANATTRLRNCSRHRPLTPAGDGAETGILHRRRADLRTSCRRGCAASRHPDDAVGVARQLLLRKVVDAARPPVAQRTDLWETHSRLESISRRRSPFENPRRVLRDRSRVAEHRIFAATRLGKNHHRLLGNHRHRHDSIRGANDQTNVKCHHRRKSQLRTLENRFFVCFCHFRDSKRPWRSKIADAERAGWPYLELISGLMSMINDSTLAANSVLFATLLRQDATVLRHDATLLRQDATVSRTFAMSRKSDLRHIVCDFLTVRVRVGDGFCDF